MIRRLTDATLQQFVTSWRGKSRHELPIPSQVVAGWIHLLGRHAVEGAGVFDLQIVATMSANTVQRIYTFNPGDFQVFAELTAVTPTWRERTAGRQTRYLNRFPPSVTSVCEAGTTRGTYILPSGVLSPAVSLS